MCAGPGQRERTPYDAIVFGPIFSPDSQHIAYVARSANKMMMVLDDKEGPMYDGIGKGSVTFSPDGKRLAYAAHNGGAWFMVVDDKPGGSYQGIGKYAWSLDSKLIAYHAGKGGKSIVVVEDTESKPYDQILTHKNGQIVFGPESTLRYLAGTGFTVFAVEERITCTR
jgi:hypothetical protein